MGSILRGGVYEVECFEWLGWLGLGGNGGERIRGVSCDVGFGI
jgi:hypothetical protein